MQVLPVASWTARARAHRVRVDDWVAPHLARRRAGVRHPVEDFLFTYYSQSPAALRRWHPGYGVILDLDGVPRPEHLSRKGYRATPEGATVSPEHLQERLPLVRGTRALLVATAGRRAHLGCFGLHEWAMVYRLSPSEVRHSGWPLRLGASGTDRVVESHRIVCSHFDAYRFFTPEAAPRNTLRPGSHDRAAFEQPGCLHAGMDLYKHAFRLTPLVPSELVADCFELARDIRALDMRASPYDFGELGYEPVPIETPAGKQQYADAQRRFAERAAPLRGRLVEECDRLLELAR